MFISLKGIEDENITTATTLFITLAIKIIILDQLAILTMEDFIRG